MKELLSMGITILSLTSKETMKIMMKTHQSGYKCRTNSGECLKMIKSNPMHSMISKKMHLEGITNPPTLTMK